MYAEHEIDNALQHQKDYLLEMLRQATTYVADECLIQDYQMIVTMMAILQANTELWTVLGYGYKGLEISQRIRQAARDSQERLHHAATAKRKHCQWIIENVDKLIQQFSLQPHL